MKEKTDIIFDDKFKDMAHDYINYKRSLGFKFSVIDQERLKSLLEFLFLVLYRCEVLDELHEPVGFGVFGTIARHAGKYGLCMATQYGKLE